MTEKDGLEGKIVVLVEEDVVVAGTVLAEPGAVSLAEVFVVAGCIEVLESLLEAVVVAGIVKVAVVVEQNGSVVDQSASAAEVEVHNYLVALTQSKSVVKEVYNLVMEVERHTCYAALCQAKQ